MGADIAASWPDRLAMLASVPTLSRGAMREGTVHATGAAAARPPNARLIQQRAAKELSLWAAPKMARPKAVPTIRTDWRTRFAFQPRWIRASTSHPPTTISVNVANSHGALV